MSAPEMFSEAGEQSGIGGRGLAVDIKLRGPPGLYAVFEFGGGGAEAVAALRASESGFRLDFEVSGLFEVVGVGDEIGLLLRCDGGGGAYGEPGDEECGAGSAAERMGERNAVQISLRACATLLVSYCL